MYIEHPSQDCLDLTYSSYGTPQINSASIRVPVREFWVLKGFPDYEDDTYFKSGYLMYEGIASSKRVVKEYTTLEKKVLKSEKIIEDGAFEEVNQEVYPCNLSGYDYDLNAWIEWDIMAAVIRVEP
jgi:hypothetical protein